MQQEKQKLRVLIQPAPKGFTAVCLELSLASEERTRPKVSHEIAELINANLASAKKGATAEELGFNAPPEDFHMFEKGKVYEYTPQLSRQVKRWYSRIEYRTYPNQ